MAIAIGLGVLLLQLVFRDCSRRKRKSYSDWHDRAILLILIVVAAILRRVLAGPEDYFAGIVFVTTVISANAFARSTLRLAHTGLRHAPYSIAQTICEAVAGAAVGTVISGYLELWNMWVATPA